MKKTKGSRSKSNKGSRQTSQKPVRAAKLPTPVLEQEPQASASELSLEDTPRSLPNFMIAGIGASAGGLEACSQLLDALPADLGLALIIIQHLAPKHDSFLPEILSAHSKMPVV